ncbi:hypothetical protein EYF80_048035 [Liparis tanakae]|uniref:Uncharacterized protein n=1 Tax=Liparis tanakae TaxID=230148 RepID=A0A4Z2FLN1_9TELE|nr:hypothetical protein EYF80_048035 [Liparis tanakae]
MRCNRSNKDVTALPVNFDTGRAQLVELLLRLASPCSPPQLSYSGSTCSSLIAILFASNLYSVSSTSILGIRPFISPFISSRSSFSLM